MLKQITNKVRLVLALEGTPVGVRIVPHKADATKLVLKASHPEVAGMLCQVMGVQPGKTWQGNSYFITEVDAQAFQKALPEFVAQAMKAARELDGLRKPALTGGKSKCPDCGVNEGPHWQFCGTKLLAN